MNVEKADKNERIQMRDEERKLGESAMQAGLRHGCRTRSGREQGGTSEILVPLRRFGPSTRYLTGIIAFLTREGMSRHSLPCVHHTRYPCTISLYDQLVRLLSISNP
jgi:hypothetical protein